MRIIPSTKVDKTICDSEKKEKKNVETKAHEPVILSYCVTLFKSLGLEVR